MFDHFNLLAPFYEWLIAAPDGERLSELLRLPLHGRLLDVGGGTGRVADVLQSSVDKMFLIDPAAGMLDQARAKRGLRLARAKVERLPFGNAVFDAVLVVDALHHFYDQRMAVAELLRVLKPGGRMVIEEPDLRRFRVKLIAVMEKVALMRSHFYSPEAIRDMIAAHGLDACIERDEVMTAWVVVDK